MRSKLKKENSKTDLLLYVISTILLISGILCIVVKGLTGEYVDADGILHENFYLIIIGYLCIFVSIIAFISLFIKKLINKKRKNK